MKITLFFLVLIITIPSHASDFKAGTYECKGQYSTGWSDLTLEVSNANENGADIKILNIVIPEEGLEESCKKAYNTVKNHTFVMRKREFANPNHLNYWGDHEPVDGIWAVHMNYWESEEVIPNKSKGKGKGKGKDQQSLREKKQTLNFFAEERGWDSPTCSTTLEFNDPKLCKFTPAKESTVDTAKVKTPAETCTTKSRAAQ